MLTYIHETGKARDELCQLRQQLHAAGLSEALVLVRLLDSLAGPPAISGMQLTELVLAVRGLQRGGIDESIELIKAIAAGVSAVSPSEFARIVRAVDESLCKNVGDVVRVLAAMGLKWNADETELLMNECESLEHLREILASNRKIETALLHERHECQTAQQRLQELEEKMQPDPPRLAPPGTGATYAGHVAVTITGDCCSDTIFATADGSAPSPTNFQAKGPSPFTFSLSEAATLRAVTHSKFGYTSPVTSECYVVQRGGPASMAGVGLLIEQEEGSDDVIITKITPGGFFLLSITCVFDSFPL